MPTILLGIVTVSRLMQLRKDPPLITITLFGITMFFSLLQSLNAYLPIVSKLSGNVKSFRLLQQLNAYSLIFLKQSGNVMFSRLLQSAKALSPILCTPPIVIFSSLLQPEKADVLMPTTLFGISTLVSNIKSENADSPIDVTPSSTTILLTLEA